MCRRRKLLTYPVPPGELHDIYRTELGYWCQYSDHFDVQVMHGLHESDGFGLIFPVVPSLLVK